MSPFLRLLCFVLLSVLACKNKAVQTNIEQEQTLPTLPINVAYSEISKNDEQKWRNIIQSYYDTIISKKLNGQILVAKNGVILFEAYIGKERLQSATSNVINEHSSIHLASCSKTFTAGAILLLQQQGKLKIEDNVTKYLPSFPYANITIKALLNHRAGLANYTHNIENWGWKTNQMASNQDVLNLLIQNKVPLLFTPDTRFNYCNTNYAILALIVEAVSKTSFPVFLKRNIFDPLQMKDSYVFQPKDTLSALPSYDWKGRIFPFNNLDGVYGDKNIYSTVKDMYKWDQALYTDKLLSEDSKNAAYTPYSNEKPGIKNYGLGWRMFNFENAKKIIFHNGWWHGNNNAFIRLIQDSATIICLGTVNSKANYSVMQLSYLFGDYPFEYEVEEGKDTAKTNAILMLEQLKLKADSIKNNKKMPIRKDTMAIKKDSGALQKPKTINLKKKIDSL